MSRDGWSATVTDWGLKNTDKRVDAGFKVPVCTKLLKVIFLSVAVVFKDQLGWPQKLKRETCVSL